MSIFLRIIKGIPPKTKVSTNSLVGHNASPIFTSTISHLLIELYTPHTVFESSPMRLYIRILCFLDFVCHTNKCVTCPGRGHLLLTKVGPGLDTWTGPTTTTAAGTRIPYRSSIRETSTSHACKKTTTN